jgi:hypothetical protein
MPAFGTSLGKLLRSHLCAGEGSGNGAGTASGLEPEPSHRADSRIYWEDALQVPPGLPKSSTAHPHVLERHAPAVVQGGDTVRQGSAVQLFDQPVTGVHENTLT